MRKDPYKVLGIDRTATDDEVKAAYRELAKKYHPDNYVGSPLADLAQEKMKEINEAYDTVSKQRQRQREERENAYYGSGDSFSGEGRERFAEIRELINQRNFADADVQLNAMEESMRNAEWHYLKGLVFTARGWYFEASRYFSTACRMDPENEEYKAALDDLKNNASNYERRSGECGVCDFCSALMCADCCCESMGGDCIRCC